MSLVYRIVNDEGEVFYSNRNLWGTYDNLQSAKLACAQAKVRMFYARDESGLRWVKTTDKSWRVQASKVEWYDVT